MDKLISGLHRFRVEVFARNPSIFSRLAAGQNPETLFLTCSDSRVDPCLLTMTMPGELFIVRNAGNFVPPHSHAPGGEQAAIEYAVQNLGVKDIVICGHTQCGAIGALLDSGGLPEHSAIRHWLTHAGGTAEVVRQRHSHLKGPALVNAAVSENVLVQLENLRTHPAVRAATSVGKLRLHGWVYDIESGEVRVFDPARGEFGPPTEAKPLPPPLGLR